MKDKLNEILDKVIKCNVLVFASIENVELKGIVYGTSLIELNIVKLIK